MEALLKVFMSAHDKLINYKYTDSVGFPCFLVVYFRLVCVVLFIYLFKLGINNYF